MPRVTGESQACTGLSSVLPCPSVHLNVCTGPSAFHTVPFVLILQVVSSNRLVGRCTQVESLPREQCYSSWTGLWICGYSIWSIRIIQYSAFPKRSLILVSLYFFFKSRLMLIPSIKSLWPCCFPKAFKLTYVRLFSCLFSLPPPLYCPLLFIPPSSLPPLSLSHTHRHTQTQTLAFWFEAPFCSSQRPPFCSRFSLHARPVALPAPTFLRVTLFCGSLLLISLQFSFVGLFFSISDLPSPFAWPCAFSSVKCLNNRNFFRKK